MSDVLGVLREKLDEKGLDAILVSGPESRRYVSGFTGSAGYLLVSRVGATLATDFRYVEQAGNQSPAFQVTKMGTGWSWLLDLLKETPFEKVGFESHQMTVATYGQITEVLKDLPTNARPSMMATQGIIEGMRTVKQAEELALLQKAIDASDAAMEAVAPTIQTG